MKQINKSPSYLIRNPYSYCFRMIIPKDLQSHFGKKELRYSLKTGYLDIAKLKARYIAGHVQTIFRILRKGTIVNLSDDQIKELVNKYIKQSLEQINNLFSDEQGEDILPFTNEPEFYSYLGELEGIRQDLIANLNIGNFVMLEDFISDFLKNHGIKNVDKNSAEYRKLCVGIHQAEIKLLPIEIRHRKNDFSYQDELPEIFPETFNALPKKESLPTPKEKPAPTLGQVIQELTATKIRHKQWRPNTIRNHQPKINTMLQVLGDKPVNHITKEDTKRLAKILDLLPPGFARLKEYKDISGLSPKDLKGKHDKTMDMSTQRDYMIFARQVFSYAKDREYITKNPVFSVDIPPKKKNPRERKYPFDDPEDLEKIFNPDVYLEACKNRPSRFWIPILLLYTGCRREEICQLYIEDVQKIEGIWCLNIKGLTAVSDDDDGDQMLKTDSAPRVIPLHPVLSDELKFPMYVKSLEDTPKERIFSDLKKYHHKYGHKFGDWFNRYIRTKKVGITDPKKSLHSFRHNVADHLYKKLVPESLIEELEGRAGKTQTRTTYVMGHRVKVLYEECISKLDYDIDLSHLKNSKYVLK